MALLVCPECKNYLSSEANFCPHCGYPKDKIIASMRQNQPTTSDNPEKKQRKIPVAVFVFIFIVTSLILTVYFMANKPRNSGSQSSRSGYSSYNTAEDAKVCAEDAVKQMLKTPTTALVCPSYEMKTTYLGSNKWRITGYVDAQNDFGVYIRKDFTVELELTENGYEHGKVTFDD